MIEKLVEMHKKGAITADHLVVESLHVLDPKHPEAVLKALPAAILERMLSFVSAYQPKSMRSNYGIQPTIDQVQAARSWIESEVKQSSRLRLKHRSV